MGGTLCDCCFLANGKICVYKFFLEYRRWGSLSDRATFIPPWLVVMAFELFGKLVLSSKRLCPLKIPIWKAE